MAGKVKTKSILKEQLPGSPAWVEQLLTPLNTTLSDLGTSFGGGLSLVENFAADIREINITTPPAFVTVSTFAASWARYSNLNFGPPGYGRTGNTCFLQGLITAGAGAYSVPFTLPLGYRPAAYRLFWDPTGLDVEIGSDGSVRIQTPVGASFVRLDICRWQTNEPFPVIAPYPIQIKTKLTARITGAVVLSVKEVNSAATLANGPVWADVQDVGGGMAQLNYVHGLRPSTTYKLRLLFLTE